MKEHHLAIQGHELLAYEYNADKDNTPLIFIHGITGNLGFWQGAQIPLMQQYRWFSLSLPAHYPAKFPANFKPESLTAEHIAEVMGEAVRQLSSGKAAILVGHSTGGFTALAIAHRYPELVKNIILIDAFALGKWYGSFIPAQAIARLGAFPFWLYFKTALASFQSFRGSYLLIARNFGAAWASQAFQASAKDAYPLIKKLDIHAMWIFFKRMPKIDIRRCLPEIKQPVSLIHGNRDWIIPFAHAEEMEKLLPNRTVYWLDDAGHLPMFENPSAYEAALTEALKGAMLETRARA